MKRWIITILALLLFSFQASAADLEVLKPVVDVIDGSVRININIKNYNKYDNISLKVVKPNGLIETVDSAIVSDEIEFSFKINENEACRFKNGLLEIIKIELKEGKIAVKAGIKVVSGSKYSSSWTYIDLKKFNFNKNWTMVSQSFEDINNLIVTFVIPSFSLISNINVGASYILKYDKDLLPLALYYIRNNNFDLGIQTLNESLEKYKFSIIKKREIENLIKSFHNNRFILRDKIIENENLFLMKIGYTEKVI